MSERSKVHLLGNIMQFWNTTLVPVLRPLYGGGYQEKVPGDLFLHLRDKIIERYSVAQLDLAPKTELLRGNADILQGSCVLNGRPTVEIFIPALMEFYADVRRTCGREWERAFENSLVIGSFHELYHLFGGHVGGGSILENEIEAWADTCQGILGFYMKNGLPLHRHYHEVWDAWTSGGSKRTSLAWIKFLAGRYGGLT